MSTVENHYSVRNVDTDYGWRGRIGLITPSRGWTIDHEWPRMLPRGLLCLTTRIFLDKTTPEAMEEMGKYALEAARLLATAQVDVIAYGCTIETMLKGRSYDRDLSLTIEQNCGVKTVTMAGAVVEAINAFGAKKISIASPYIEEINESEKAFLEEAGIKVVYEEGLKITDTVEIAKIPPGDVYRFAKEVNARGEKSELLFLSCGNLRTIEILDTLERDIGKPVLSSNQAMLWAAMKAIGIQETIVGYGSIFTK